MALVLLMENNGELFKAIYKRHVNESKFIGIGTGKTMEAFSAVLPYEKNYIASSYQSVMFLKQHNLVLTENVCEVDVYFDSADYVNRDGDLIKGGGGALFKEKLLTRIAKKSVIIVEKTKIVDSFEKLEVPVEVIPVALNYVISQVEDFKLKYSVKKSNNLTPFVTDNGNLILNVQYDSEFFKLCKLITGVVEHGLFYNYGFVIEQI